MALLYQNLSPGVILTEYHFAVNCSREINRMILLDAENIHNTRNMDGFQQFFQKHARHHQQTREAEWTFPLAGGDTGTMQQGKPGVCYMSDVSSVDIQACGWNSFLI